ncbi:hypothetical protein [uncultured Desulfobulbus sp.]|uniref:hypothetical protein n=1 Tax=uncultured Desulfobulbus sp. TaxID=239745 RepID=UPI0029C71DAB|nr:hypothetical protein [uncultured Desulfobulbus sp.]
MKTWGILSLFTLFLMTLIPSSYAADLPTKVDRPVIKVGDTWTYIKSVGTNTGTVTYKVVSLQPGGGYEVEVQSSSKGTWTEKNDPNGNVVEDGASIFSPSREIFRFPLEVGKLYSGSAFSRKSPKDPMVNFTLQAKIKSITPERLVMKAGTFNTLKVEVETSYDGRNSRGNNVSSRVDETYWYAPEVGRWVKRHYNDLKNPGLEIWELESFKRVE